VARIPTEFKRLFLREIAWTAEDSAITLNAQLKLVARARISETETGRSIVSTSANGQSVTFSSSLSSDYLTQANITELCEELLTCYSAAVTASGSAVDSVILTEMLALLEQNTELYQDFSEIYSHR
jgi:hypothetical protein